MSYGYVKNRIFSKNAMFGAEMAQKMSKTTHLRPIHGPSSQNMGLGFFCKIQKLFLLMR